jgi:thiamine kinase-like enzyme
MLTSFSHNDFYEGNILKKGNTFIAIDFEMCHYNYRCYDIGHYFIIRNFDFGVTEYPYFKYRKDAFPSEERMKMFIELYIKHANKETNKDFTVERLLFESKLCCLLSAILNTIRAVGSTLSVSSAAFDYLVLLIYYRSHYFIKKQSRLI